MERLNITIVGAGVIGLAVARELSYIYENVFVLEKNPAFGQETSSRNSEVIHAGIYYPKDSLKAKTCLEGKTLLYEFCSRNNIAHKKIGKLIVAVDKNEIKDLEELFRQGLKNGVEDLKLLSRNELKRLESKIEAEAAVYSPSTGIIDSHSLMATLGAHFKARGGEIAYNTEVIGINKRSDGFEVTVKDMKGELFKFLTKILINCAGLNSDKVAAMVGLWRDDYRLKYCKGDYFRVHPSKAKFIQRLVYPVPKKAGAGLGIHCTLDLAGALRLGPDDEYVEKIDYLVDPEKGKIFYESLHTYLPFIHLQDISPDMSGIRPKLQGPNEDFRDFIIQDETNNGFPGLINLIGIESPGLTSCLSIANSVREIIIDNYDI